MQSRTTLFAGFAFALAFACVTAAYSAEEPQSRGVAHGTAVDASGGVLPGVTVVATTASGDVLGTATTNDAGRFAFDALPTGPVELVFHLDGFADARTRLSVPAAGEAQVVERLEIANLTESVVVRGAPPPPPPPPPPEIVPIPAHDHASVCGPAKAGTVVESLGVVRSRLPEDKQGLYTTGDQIVIDGGTANGLGAGQNLVVRRRYQADRSSKLVGEHTSGLLQIVSADESSSTAIVVYACDEMMRGDYLARFEPEPLRAPDPYGAPIFDAPARVLFADAGQMLGFPPRLMVIDKGSDHGMRPAQRLTIFRKSRHGQPAPTVVGDAVVVAVRADSATIRIERATDVVVFGDFTAQQK